MEQGKAVKGCCNIATVVAISIRTNKDDVDRSCG